MSGMVRGRRRRLPGAQSAVRWVAADARDVARIHGSSAGTGRGVPGGCRGRDGRGRIGALAAPRGAPAPAGRRPPRRARWASAPRASCSSARSRAGTTDPASGCCRPRCRPSPRLRSASPTARARRPPRACSIAISGSAPGSSTALELETSAERAASGRGLGALVLADVRGALGRSLPGARARLQPRRREAALLAALVAALAALLLVPSPRTGRSRRGGGRAAGERR